MNDNRYIIVLVSLIQNAVREIASALESTYHVTVPAPQRVPVRISTFRRGGMR